jgi:prepilin-type N-terminal cleavage/methylation domain-containing protein
MGLGMLQKRHHQEHTGCLGSESGFTLLEVILAISILTVGLLAVASMQITAIQGNDFSKSVTESSDQLQDAIEELLTINYNNLRLQDGTGANDGVAGLDDQAPNADGSVSNPPYQIFWNVANDWAGGKTATGITTIRVYVLWRDRGVQKSHVFDFLQTTIL